MHNHELEQRLRTAVEHATPDQLDRILSSCNAQKGTVIPMKNKKKKARWASLAIAAALAVMVCGGFGLHGWRTTNAVAAVVSLDVNPSIQLQVNQKEKILAAEALNKDAEIILDGMNLKGTDLNVAVKAIVGSLLQNGYLDSLSSAILISVEDNDSQRANRLQTELSAQVDTALQQAAAGAAVLSQVVTYDAGLEAQAQTNHISVGKAALIQNIQKLNRDLVFENLAALSVEELKQMMETGAKALPIGISTASYSAQDYAGLLEVDAVVADVDPELDESPAHYEVELQTYFGAFDYVVDAYTGEVLKGRANILSVPQDASEAVTPAASASITEAKAQSIALSHAGVSTEKALGLKINLDWDDGVFKYEVEFRADSVEYDYEILATDGTILKAEQDTDDSWAPTSDAKPSTPSQSPTPSAAFIGESSACTAALQHAGIRSGDVVHMECELDQNNGLQVYEIEFKTGDAEYEYEIDAATGAVLKFEQDTGD